MKRILERARAATLLLLAIALTTPRTGRAQIRDSVALQRRAGQIVAMMKGSPFSGDTIFNAAFLAQVPAAQLHTLFAQLGQLGAVQSVTMSKPAAGTPAVEFQLATDKGYSIPMTLSVESAAPNLINGLQFAAPLKTTGTLDDLLKEIRALPGHASLFAARVDGTTLIPLAAVDTGRPLAIGSAFKLYVLAELIQQIERGQRHWSDVVTLDSSSRSLPSGILQTWPVGTPITLQTLATLMISQSDNTAADNLLHTLERDNVEKIQRVAGNTHAAMNEPFLTTREMFVLKTPSMKTRLQQYIAGNTEARRAILADPAVIARVQGVPDFSGGPNAIESVEWFASTTDLARTMVWIRDHSATGPAAAARGVLSVNKGIAWPRGTWTYAAFKGGSEPGVLNLTLLGQRTDGKWFVVVGTWNDPSKDVDETTWLALVTRARDLIGKSN